MVRIRQGPLLGRGANATSRAGVPGGFEPWKSQPGPAERSEAAARTVFLRFESARARGRAIGRAEHVGTLRRLADLSQRPGEPDRNDRGPGFGEGHAGEVRPVGGEAITRAITETRVTSEITAPPRGIFKRPHLGWTVWRFSTVNVVNGDDRPGG